MMEIFTFLLRLGGICLFFVCGASVVEADSVFVMEGDAVTLYTADKMNQQDRMTWFSGVNRIAAINGDQSMVCTDDWCKERFRDRLKLDHQTGSLTITNTRTTDSGLYQLKVTSRNTGNIFSVTVHAVSAPERDEIKRKSVKKGESVTLESGKTKNPNDEMTWYYNGILIAEITGDQSKICTDDQCKERFRDRLKLDNQTGSLTITNTRTTDSGLYTLQIISRGRFSIIRIFTVTVTDSGSSSGSSSAAAAAAVVVVLLLLLLLVAAVVFYQRKAIMKCIRRQRGDQTNVAEKPPPERHAFIETATNGTSHNETEAANET